MIQQTRVRTLRTPCDRCRGTGTAIRIAPASVNRAAQVREVRCNAPHCVDGWVFRSGRVHDPLL
jgi:hypothetical protein